MRCCADSSALEPTRDKVLARKKVATWDDADEKYCLLSGYCFYNLTSSRLGDLGASRTYDALMEYIGGFWENAREVLLKFKMENTCKELDKKGRLELKKGLAYTLRKRSRDLKPSEASALRDLRADASYGVLMAAYDLKEDFFDVYDANPASRDAAEAAYDAWKASAPEASGFEPFRALGRTIDNHRELIFNWWGCPARISNGYTECANRLIAEADMKGRGYDFEVLRARTLYRKQNLERIMASGGLSIGPRVDSEGPLFHIEPDCDGVDELIDPLPGAKIDADTGEVLECAKKPTRSTAGARNLLLGSKEAERTPSACRPSSRELR